MNPDNCSDVVFKVMRDDEWVELPAFPNLTIFSKMKINQYQRNLLRMYDFDIPNNFLKFKGMKMRRRK